VFMVPDGFGRVQRRERGHRKFIVITANIILFTTLHNSDRVIDNRPTFGGSRTWRGTIIAVRDSPEGPFLADESDGLCRRRIS